MLLKLATFVFLLTIRINAVYYEEKVARKILPLASAAYALDPAPCLKKNYGNVEVVKRYEEICDSSNRNTCSGYLALLHTEKVIAVVFRGNITDLQFKFQSIAVFLPKQNFEKMGNINKYYFDAFWVLWRKAGMGLKLKELIDKYPNYGLWVTGHSLGAALSSLASAKILKENPRFDMTNSKHYNFGQPRVGDQQFVESHNKIVPDFFRVTHARDLLSDFPASMTVGYLHHKMEVWYNNSMALGGRPIFCPSDSDSDCSGLKRNSWNDNQYYFGQWVTNPQGC